jgi:hypothetical protein
MATAKGRMTTTSGELVRVDTRRRPYHLITESPDDDEVMITVINPRTKPNRVFFLRNGEVGVDGEDVECGRRNLRSCGRR